MKKEICFVVSGYPTKENPEGAFIKPVISAFADRGYFCTVLCPQSITAKLNKKRIKRKEFWIDQTENRNEIRVVQPMYFSFSNIRIFGIGLTSFFRVKALKRSVKKYKINTELLYGHFWENGIDATQLVKNKNNTKVIVASGESKIRVHSLYSQRKIKKLLPLISKVVFVSTKNKIESEQLGLLVNKPQTIVLPNGYNPQEFYKISKCKARERLGLNKDDNIVSFVGEFCERKGVMRLVKAVDRCGNAKLLLIGKGSQKPVSKNIIYSGQLPHEEIVYYLGASDMFVLPTLAEGCCNAIVEAMACGLPIISSDMSFNDDILDDMYSIRVNPNSISSIAEAITKLISNKELKETMGENAYLKSSEFQIDKRVDKLIAFIEAE